MVLQSFKGSEQDTFKAPILHKKEGHFCLTFPSHSVTSSPPPPSRHVSFHLCLSPSRSLLLVFSGHRVAHLELRSEWSYQVVSNCAACCLAVSSAVDKTEVLETQNQVTVLSQTPVPQSSWVQALQKFRNELLSNWDKPQGYICCISHSLGLIYKTFLIPTLSLSPHRGVSSQTWGWRNALYSKAGGLIRTSFIDPPRRVLKSPSNTTVSLRDDWCLPH